MIEEMKTKFSLSYDWFSQQVGVSLATLMRWKKRLRKARPRWGKRGPKKVRPFKLDKLREKVEELDHVRKRTHGTGQLYGAVWDSISRRDFNEMVRQVRQETNRQQKSESCQVTWLRPNLAWAMDDCRKTRMAADGTLHIHNLTDLCSRYKLPPLASDHLPCGEEVAGHLDYLFGRFGAPLFCKRDNGGNLNHTAVNDVLEQAQVIPLNSPVYNAPYNGAIEHTQGEFKSYLQRWQWKANTISEFSLLVEVAAHDLYHNQRRCLNGRSSCSAYFGECRLQYSKRHRKSVYQWVYDLASEISRRTGLTDITPVSWRVAVKQWLIKNALIKIRKVGNVGEVSPIYP